MPPRKKKRVHKKVDLVDTWGRANRKLPDIPCRHCGKMFRPDHHRRTCCSRECGYASRDNKQWQKRKNGRYKGQKGYITCYIWVNGKREAHREHRLVMEKHLGRKLTKWEVVHHINEIPDDNRIENLQVMSHAEHTRLHHLGKGNKMKGKKLVLTTEQRQKRSDDKKKYWEQKKAKAILNRINNK